MKKIIYSLSIISVMILVLLSCIKNSDEVSSQFSQASQMIQDGQSFEQRILSFKSAIESGLKSGYSYPIDSAVRYTEALVNYTYADVRNNLQGLTIDSVFIEVDLSSGKITPAEVANTYDMIIDSLTIQYQNLPSQNLHLVFADVFSRDSTAGTVFFGIISGFSYGSPISTGGFGEEDYWIFGWSWCNSGGYCEPSEFAGTHTNDDAAEQIERKIRNQIGVPSGRYFAYDVITFEIWPDGIVDDLGDQYDDYYCDFLNYNDQNTQDNYYDNLIFTNYSEWPNFHYCLCPEEMNFYWVGTKEVSTDILYSCEDIEEVIANKAFMSIDILGTNDLGEEYHYCHIMTNSYGIWIYNPNIPGTF
jgi:hypothetical protein